MLVVVLAVFVIAWLPHTLMEIIRYHHKFVPASKFHTRCHFRHSLTLPGTSSLCFWPRRHSSIGRAFTTQIPLMPGCRYMEEIGSEAMLDATKLAGESQGTCDIQSIPLQSANKAEHSGFEILMSHEKSKTGVSVGPQKDLCPQKFKNQKILHFCALALEIQVTKSVH